MTNESVVSSCTNKEKHDPHLWRGFTEGAPLRCPGVEGEAVNHPSHYGGEDNPHEVIKCLAAWGLLDNAPLFNVVKYIARAGKKGSKVEDLKKARWYLDYEIERQSREGQTAS